MLAYKNYLEISGFKVLYIENKNNVSTVDHLSELINNITMILNCTTGVDFPAIDIQKVRIPLSERIEDDLHLLKINIRK